MASLRSLVTDITGVKEKDGNFEAAYKKVQRIHKLLGKLTKTDMSSEIAEQDVPRFVSLSSNIYEKFTGTDEGNRIEKLLKKLSDNKPGVSFEEEEVDLLTKWFLESDAEYLEKHDDAIAEVQNEFLKRNIKNEQRINDVKNLFSELLNEFGELYQIDKSGIALESILNDYEEMMNQLTFKVKVLTSSIKQAESLQLNTISNETKK